MASTYKTIVLASRPKGDIIPSEQFKTVEKPRPTEADLKDDEVLVENLYLSLDPAMRGWMTDRRSYIPPVALNSTMRGATIARILSSKSPSPSHAPGSYVTTSTSGWAELAVAKAKDLEPLSLPPNGRLTDAMGPLGLTGLTAYFGLLEIGKPKAGETVVVSGAAGATGSIVVQIAKIKGCRVVGVAGGKEKVAWLKELGVDEAVDYKAADFKEKFLEATKGFIDVFFDNTGGEALELALAQAKPFARFVMCGAISQYNSTGPAHGPANFTNIIGMRIRMQGFIVFDFAKDYPTARREISQWLSDGKLQRKEHIVKGGLEAAPEALLGLFKGANTGKTLVEIKAPELEGGSEAKL